MRFASPLTAFLACCALGCSTVYVGPDAPLDDVQRLLSHAPPEVAYDVALDVAAGYGWRISSRDARAGTFAARVPGGARRLADEVSVVVTGSDGGSEIAVASGLGQGPNLHHVEGYLDALARAL